MEHAAAGAVTMPQWRSHSTTRGLNSPTTVKTIARFAFTGIYDVFFQLVKGLYSFNPFPHTRSRVTVCHSIIYDQSYTLFFVPIRPLGMTRDSMRSSMAP